MATSHHQCINKQGYFLRSTGLENDVHRVERRQNYSVKTKKHNIYSNYWMLYLYDLPKGRLKIRHGRKIIEVAGPKAIYIPPLTPVTFEFSAGLFEWTAYYINSKGEKGLPHAPKVFQWNKQTPLKNYAQIMDFLLRKENGIHADLSYNSSHVVSKVQTFINRHYSEPIDLMSMSKDLGLPYSTISHSFQHMFGFSPIVYRNTVRTFKALQLIGQGQSLTDACYLSGFSDYSTFYRNFNTILDNKPSEFIQTPPSDYEDNNQDLYLCEGYL
ncbi:MAG: helix-turn-helix transcriptional regulator [Alphaproteobacteria bacterium]|nr:helix-turn-helix transcriptional regulator [Alphaproteobacteria bacterium]